MVMQAGAIYICSYTEGQNTQASKTHTLDDGEHVVAVVWQLHQAIQVRILASQSISNHGSLDPRQSRVQGDTDY